MRKPVGLMASAALLASSLSTVVPPTPVAGPSYTCGGSGLSRVALGQCCRSVPNCAQPLSTEVFMRSDGPRRM